MAVFTKQYMSLSGVPRTVSIARSKPSSTSDWCLIVGTDQIANLSVSIVNTDTQNIHGLFFHGITTQEIMDELQFSIETNCSF